MLEASGYDVIIIETVGVGQSEFAITQTADTTILVLMQDRVMAFKRSNQASWKLETYSSSTKVTCLALTNRHLK